jgi:DNA-binding Lrp family transcriptional regulator
MANDQSGQILVTSAATRFGIPSRNSHRIIYGFAADFCETDGAMNPLIKLLLEGGGLSTAQMAQVLNLTEAEVNHQLDQLKKDRLLLGWRPVLNLADEDAGVVRAVIEVKITPERGGGFNRLAERISRFDEVESCYLMSGGYDLLVFVNGSSLQKVAAFVSEKLSTIEGVLSTATHFLLRSYKEQGFLMDVKAEENSRLKVTP